MHPTCLRLPHRSGPGTTGARPAASLETVGEGSPPHGESPGRAPPRREEPEGKSPRGTPRRHLSTGTPSTIAGRARPVCRPRILNKLSTSYKQHVTRWCEMGYGGKVVEFIRDLRKTPVGFRDRYREGPLIHRLLTVEAAGTGLPAPPFWECDVGPRSGDAEGWRRTEGPFERSVQERPPLRKGQWPCTTTLTDSFPTRRRLGATLVFPFQTTEAHSRGEEIAGALVARSAIPVKSVVKPTRGVLAPPSQKGYSTIITAPGNVKARRRDA